MVAQDVRRTAAKIENRFAGMSNRFAPASVFHFRSGKYIKYYCTFFSTQNGTRFVPSSIKGFAAGRGDEP